MFPLPNQVSISGFEHKFFFMLFMICITCSYDYIAHLETLDEDLTYIFTMANPTIQRDQLVTVGKRNVAQPKSEEIERELLKELPKELITRTMQIYQQDFDLFGYEFNESLSLKLNSVNTIYDQFAREKK